MNHDALEGWRITITGITASLYMIYASICIMRADSRTERLLSMAVFLLGAITIQLVR